MASDLSVVNGARVSFARHKAEMDDSDAGLIRFLMRERHGTPFEHNAFRFHVRCPIFVAREWFRHRVGSFNEFSMRYAKRDRRLLRAGDRRTSARRSASPAHTPSSRSPDEMAETTRERLRGIYETAYAAYEELVELGVARELARAALPVGAYTEFYWTVNARSLMNFVSLRAAETAQREIRRYAEAVERSSPSACRSRMRRSWRTTARRPNYVRNSASSGGAFLPVVTIQPSNFRKLYGAFIRTVVVPSCTRNVPQDSAAFLFFVR